MNLLSNLRPFPVLLLVGLLGTALAQEPPGALGPDEACLDCHAALTEAEWVHGAVEAELCTECHTQPDETKHAFELPERLAEACSNCHELPQGEILHDPVRQGHCAACHEPHASQHPFLLRDDDEAVLCGSCHADKLGEGLEFVHGPVAAGVCTACHLPHASEQESLLRDEPVSVCLSCHEDMASRLAEAEMVHLPVEVDCTLCHDPHASAFPSQLRAGGRALCLECHDDIGGLLASPVDHGAVTTARECLNCHQPHHSAFPRLLDRSSREICLDCHERSVDRAEGDPLLAMGEVLKAEFLHGPIREGNCSACHEPHGGEHASILRKPYPERFYSPWDPVLYQLCFSCHDQAAFTEAATTSLTSFRDGARNLHHLHVNRTTKGRTCRACHDTHASSLPKHLAEEVPFGRWKLPIRYAASATGGSCSPGCHGPRSYDRERLAPAPAGGAD